MACTDEPMSLFAVELAEMNPDALVILTVRDSAEQYANSCLRTQGWGKFAKFEENQLAQMLGRQWFDMMIPTIQNVFDVPENLINEDRALDEARRQWLIDNYNKHNAFIRDKVPEQRLIVLNVKDGWDCKGWKKLADKFGVEIPRGKFPNWNSTEQFHQLVTGS